MADTGPPEYLADALRAVARRHGTPAYVLDLATLDRDAAAMTAAFPDPWLRRFSVKANDVPAVIAAVAARGFGANVVSGGEWANSTKAGLPNASITLEGIGKTDADLRAAVRASADGRPLAWLAVESVDELAVIDRLARRAGLGVSGRPAIDVLLRLNPAVAPETSSGLAVGRAGSKFGMDETELTGAAEAFGERPAIRLRGIHLHVGSQLGAVDAWRDGVRRALAVAALLRGNLPAFDTVDVGGGFPVGEPGVVVPSPERFARELPALLETIPADRRPARLAIEPGRALVARAGWLVASVLHVRARGERQVVLDAGMTELVRPALYGARHPIVAVTSMGRAWPSGVSADDRDLVVTSVEGPICESTDSLGIHDLPALRRGDIVAIGDAGAYGASQSSTYNGRRRPPQVLVSADGRLNLVRRRGTTRSLS